MKKIALLLTTIAAIFFTTEAYAQQKGQNIEPVPFQLVDEKPSFDGGDINNFTKWICTRILYPEVAKAKQIEGRVVVKFVVDEKGKVRNVKVVKGVHESLDQEAIRVISKSPKWTPGEQNGKAVPVMITAPVNFYIR